MEGESNVHPNLIALVDHCTHELSLVCKLTFPIEPEKDSDAEDEDSEVQVQSKCSTRDALARVHSYLEEG